MDDAALAGVVLHCNVYARASPENKIRIVKALQSHHQIVSMTGDGVNDAPSLKAANIGVAMGITGTDVSKEAAKIVLSDDNFATIVHAVREGRRVWDNLVKVFLYNLPTNFAQGLVVFFSFALGMKESPLTPIQVLYVNMIISVSLGGALSFEPEEDGIMTRKPRDSALPLVSKYIMFRTLWLTSAMVVAIIGIFNWAHDGKHYPVGQARAVAFTLLVISSVFYGLNCRSTTEFSLGPSLLRPNKAFWFSFLLVPTMQAIIVHIGPINQFFSCESRDVANGQCVTMGSLEWGPIIGIAVALFLLVELEKALKPTLWDHVLGPFFAHALQCLPSWHPTAHEKGTEGSYKFYATSASFHGVATKVSHGGAPSARDHPAEKPGSRFSARSLRAKAHSHNLGLSSSPLPVVAEEAKGELRGPAAV